MDTAQVHCPYCGERLELLIDWSLSSQEYIEDCQVCCRPMTLVVTLVRSDDGSCETTVAARTADD